MTRREQFAAAALSGLARAYNGTEESRTSIAKHCFELADAMEAEAVISALAAEARLIDLKQEITKAAADDGVNEWEDGCYDEEQWGFVT